MTDDTRQQAADAVLDAAVERISDARADWRGGGDGDFDRLMAAAAFAGCCRLGCDQGACESCPCCCAGWCLNGGTDLPDDADDLRLWLDLAREHGSALVPVGERLLAAVLASSPAGLPPAPEPTGRDSAGAYWDVAHGGKVDVLLLAEDAHRVYVELADSSPNRTYTAHEARLLASTLLAAADVAEGRQP